MVNLSTSYQDLATARSGPSVSRIERSLLCDLLDQVGPAQPTLCEGWSTHHLAAHLTVREGRLDGQLKSLLPGRGDALTESTVGSQDFSELVDRIRRGPSRFSLHALPMVEPRLNTLEFFIHHEDVRRAAATWEPRVLPAWAETQIWDHLTSYAKLMSRRSPRGVVLSRTDTGEESVARKGPNSRTIEGTATEIALYMFGRRQVAEVERTG